MLGMYNYGSLTYNYDIALVAHNVLCAQPYLYDFMDYDIEGLSKVPRPHSHRNAPRE